ncbi:MAG: hypothetical protein NVSMB14_17490 [Isosphaeraceae bacterium]
MNKPMLTVQLSDDREQFVRSLLQDGSYSSEAELIDDALRLLQERDDEFKLAELRKEIALGIEEIDGGELEPFEPLATLARIREPVANPHAMPKRFPS